MAFLPAACFLRLTMRPALVFIKSFFLRPPDVCLAVPWNTSALLPTVFGSVMSTVPQEFKHLPPPFEG